MISLLESLHYVADLLPVPLGNTGEIFDSTSITVHSTGADADSVDKLA